MISDHRPNTIVKILETALASKGATLTKLIHKLDLTEDPDKLEMYMSILEDNRFLRTYNHTIDLLSNLEKEYKNRRGRDFRLRFDL